MDEVERSSERGHSAVPMVGEPWLLNLHHRSAYLMFDRSVDQPHDEVERSSERGHSAVPMVGEPWLLNLHHRSAYLMFDRSVDQPPIWVKAEVTFRSQVCEYQTSRSQ